MRGNTRARWTLIVALGAALGGCANLPINPRQLPANAASQQDQLILHSDRPAAEQQRMLEELRAQRGELLGRLALAPSDEPIHVYLFDTEDSFARFIREQYPQFPSRRAFFVQTSNQLSVYAHWSDRVAEDLRHEVAHGYLHSSLPTIPLWIDEGLAEFFETPRNQNGYNTPHVQLLATQLQSGQWRPNIERLESLERVGDMRQEDYAEAWAWMHWMLTTEPARRDVLCNYLASLSGSGPRGSFAAIVRQMDPAAEAALVTHLGRLTQNGR